MANVAQLVGAPSHLPKGCRFDPQSGHLPWLQVRSPLGQVQEANQSVFLSLPYLLSKINKHLLRVRI